MDIDMKIFGKNTQYNRGTPAVRVVFSSGGFYLNRSALAHCSLKSGDPVWVGLQDDPRRAYLVVAEQEATPPFILRNHNGMAAFASLPMVRKCLFHLGLGKNGKSSMLFTLGEPEEMQGGYRYRLIYEKSNQQL